MSKPVKQMMMDMYRRMFEGVDGVVLVDIRGIPANENNVMRMKLAESKIKVTVVKNRMIEEAFEGTELGNVTPLLEGPCAFAYGLDEDTSVVNVARVLLDVVKEVDELEVKGAVMEGQIFQADEVERLSKYPTREEALSEFMTLVLSPGRKLAGAFNAPGSELVGAIGGPSGNVAGLLGAVKAKLEAGETIA